MPRIQMLSPVVINQIAAGEVIERPASAVKELVENSLDAGASQIRVELEEGGCQLLLVEDDGHGIEPEDLELALTSHATSKIRDAEDLCQVASMGFRGEALASIASVARVKLISRTAEGEGFCLEADGGKLGERRPAAGRPGTRIEVRELFFNLPARRKFLKSTAAEMRAVTRCLQQLSLARPDVRFELYHAGKEVLITPAVRSAAQRIADIFGGKLASTLIPIASERKGLRLTGLVAPAAQGKGTSSYQFFFLNRRPVRDKTVVAAVKEAYSGLLVGRRYPVVFLYLEMDPQEVDINVHPCKTEVRFVTPSRVFALFRGAVRDAVLESSEAPVLQQGHSAAPPPSTPAPAPAPRPTWPREASAAPVVDESLPLFAAATRAQPDQAAEEPVAPRPGRYLQVFETFLVEEGPQGLRIHDQHALHEKLIYLRLKAQLQAEGLSRQGLLIPEVVEVSPADVALAEEFRAVLAEAGFEVDAFSERSLAVRSVPALGLRAKRSAESLFSAALDYLRDLRPGQKRLAEKVLDGVLASVACKAAVKAGDKLEDAEIQTLLQKAAETDYVQTCPHGRPTVLDFPKSDLLRQFHRTL